MFDKMPESIQSPLRRLYERSSELTADRLMLGSAFVLTFVILSLGRMDSGGTKALKEPATSIETDLPKSKSVVPARRPDPEGALDFMRPWKTKSKTAGGKGAAGKSSLSLLQVFDL